MVATIAKQQKEVTILARAQFKNNSKAVVYKVLSSNGIDEYYTTIYDGKAASCTCPATKPCYHMVQLQAYEEARQVKVDAAKQAKLEQYLEYEYACGGYSHPWA